VAEDAAEQHGSQEQASETTADNGQSQADSSGADDGTATPNARADAVLPDGFETPESCPDIVKLSLPDEEKSLPEMHSWFCGRFDAAGTPAYDATDDEMLGSACTLESLAIQGATRNRTRELRCFDDEARTIGLMLIRQGDVSNIRTYEYDGNGEVIYSVSGNGDRCSITRRNDDTKVTFVSQTGEGLQAASRVEYDDEGRVIERLDRQSGGGLAVSKHEYTSTEQKKTHTKTYNGEKATETVEFLRADGTVERKIERAYSDGKLISATETHFDEQGRVTKTAPPEDSEQKFASVETKEYEGDFEHPVRRTLVRLVDGEEQGSITITYEIDAKGRPVSSEVALAPDSTVEETWSYADGRLIEKHIVENPMPGRNRFQMMHFEIEYDDAGRPTFHHRWRGQKDTRTYAGWKTTMTYGCMK
jgi:hypothetical protein